MGTEENTKGKSLRRISVMNWIGTLILCSIPGVNVIALIIYAFFSKAQAKRSFAVAVLLLTLFVAAIICAAFLIFPEQLANLASQLRGSLPKTGANVVVLQ